MNVLRAKENKELSHLENRLKWNTYFPQNMECLVSLLSFFE